MTLGLTLPNRNGVVGMMSDHRFVETPVGRLAVRTRGEGPPAVLWHSLFVDDRSWHRVEDELAAERRLILVTGPGHGRSGDPGRRYTQVTLLLLVYVVAGPTRYLADGIAETMLSPRTRAEDLAAVDLLRSSFAGADRRGLANAVVSISLLRKDLSHLLPRIACPTLFITGADHPGWTPEQARAAAALLPDGAVAVVPDAAYLPPLEAPGATVDHLRRFWAAHPMSPPA